MPPRVDYKKKKKAVVSYFRNSFFQRNNEVIAQYLLFPIWIWDSSLSKPRKKDNIAEPAWENK